MSKTRMERFWEKVMPEPMSGCWLWIGASDRLGYGSFHYGTGKKAYRFSYEIHKGQIPHKYVIDHLCRNPSCVNPEHLEAVTHRTNTMRGKNHVVAFLARDSCQKGHKYPANVKISTWDSSRVCRVCANERKRNKRCA